MSIARLGAAAAALLVGACGLAWVLWNVLDDAPRESAIVPTAAPAAARGQSSTPALAADSQAVESPAPRPVPEDPAPEVPSPAVPAERERPAAAPPRQAAHRPAVTLRGRVIDVESSQPVPGCLVACTHADGALQAASDSQGAFRLRVPAGVSATLSVVASPEGWLVRESELAIDTERAALAEITFFAQRWPPPVAGPVRGWLRSERGSWEGNHLEYSQSISLDLVSSGQPRIMLRAQIEELEGQLVFEFSDVPRGEYELTLSSLDHFRWTPTSVLVSPPAESIEFVRLDADRTVDLEFVVTDAESGARIEEFELFHIRQTVSEENGILMQVGPLNPKGFPLDSELSWSVEADGYAPAFGDERSFQVHDGKWVAEVRLRRGWAARFQVIGRDPSMRPLAGALLFLDGDEIGGTDRFGAIHAAREEAPESIEFRYRDWVVREDLRARLARGASAVRRQVIMVQMVPPD